MPDVRPATTADLPAIGRVLAAAFADDPLSRYMASPKADWAAQAPPWFEANARAQLRGHGEVWVDGSEGSTGVRGAAIWSPPGHWKGTLGQAVAIAIPSLRLFRSRATKALRVLSDIEGAHPADPPHWYLAILGTDPARQGAGVGSALIRKVTERCDLQGLGAYLESSKEQNVPFYARHGFEVIALHDPGDQPPAWLMWRDPA